MVNTGRGSIVAQSNSAGGMARSRAGEARLRLVYSADQERHAVDAWVRDHQLWRTSLYHVLKRNPRLRLAVVDEALRYSPAMPLCLDVSLARDAGRWSVALGPVAASFDLAEPAVGLFAAGVLGEARVRLVRRAGETVSARLDMHAAGVWTEILVHGETGRPLSARDQVETRINA
jgi:hypothetical protein